MSLPTVASALAMVEALPNHPDRYYVQQYPYQRVYFGPAWSDTDDNGRGTRDDVLAAQLSDVELDLTGNVTAGHFVDPYTSQHVTYVRGREEADPVVIDHVVSLWEAWAAGAWAWTPDERETFANDPLNLVATTYNANEDKGPQNPSRWHPAEAAARCQFAVRVVAVKAKYGLQVHADDREWLRHTLTECAK